MTTKEFHNELYNQVYLALDGELDKDFVLSRVLDYLATKGKHLTPEQLKERNNEICRLKIEEGLSFVEIGKQLGISASRAGQICKRFTRSSSHYRLTGEFKPDN
jgi:DNA-binding NarL/FixJ family response regulator